MPGASRFWTRKDSDLVSQHVDIPLEYIKKTLDEKQLYRDQTEAGLLNDDYKSPNKVKWNEAQTKAVDSYNERKKNERLKAQELFYNSPIDNTNQVASTVLANRRKTADEWKEGTGEAYGLQQLYNQDIAYEKDMAEGIDKKRLNEEDVNRSRQITRGLFNKKFKDSLGNENVNNISLNPYNPANYFNYNDEAIKIVEKNMANKNVTQRQNGTFIDIQGREYANYEELVNTTMQGLASNEQAKTYLNFRTDAEKQLYKLKYNNPKEYENNINQMKEELLKRSNDLYERASGDDATYENLGRFKTKEEKEKYRKDNMTYTKDKLDKMTPEEVISKYTEHSLIDPAVGMAASLKSFMKDDLSKVQDNLMVQNAHSDYVKRQEAEGKAIERANAERLAAVTRKVGTNVVGINNINENGASNEIDKNVKVKYEGGFWNILKGIGQTLGTIPQMLTGQTAANMAAYIKHKTDKGETFNISDIAKNSLDPEEKFLFDAAKKQLINSDTGQKIIANLNQQAVNSYQNAGNFLGINPEDHDTKLNDWVKDRPEMEDKTRAEQEYAFYNDRIKAYSKEAQAKNYNTLKVHGTESPEDVKLNNQAWLGESVEQKVGDKTIKVYKPGLMENATWDYTDDKGVFKKITFNEMIKNLYGNNDDESVQDFKNRTSYANHISVDNKLSKDSNGDFSAIAGGNTFTYTPKDSKSITLIGSGTEGQRSYAIEYNNLFHSDNEIGKPSSSVNVEKLRDVDGNLNLTNKNGEKVPIGGNIYTKDEVMYIPDGDEGTAYFDIPKGADKNKFKKQVITRQYTTSNSGQEVPLDVYLGYAVGYDPTKPTFVNGNIPQGIEVNNVPMQLQQLVDGKNPHLNSSANPDFSMNMMGKVNNTMTTKSSESNYKKSSVSSPVQYVWDNSQGKYIAK